MGQVALFLLDLVLKIRNISLRVSDLLIQHFQIHVGLVQVSQHLVIVLDRVFIISLSTFEGKLGQLFFLCQLIRIILDEHISCLHCVSHGHINLADLDLHLRKIAFGGIGHHGSAGIYRLFHLACLRRCSGNHDRSVRRRHPRHGKACDQNHRKDCHHYSAHLFPLCLIHGLLFLLFFLCLFCLLFCCILVYSHHFIFYFHHASPYPSFSI